MFLWFVGTALVAMWLTFRDPAIDHRLVVVGAVLPLVIDGVAGRVWLSHTLLFPIVGLCLVMLTTIGRRQRRRQLLAVPIGVFWHLVFDGVWTDRAVFWWPLDGWGVPRQALPVVERGLWLGVVFEVIGLLALGWVVVAFGLRDGDRRRRFVRYGRIDRGLTDPGQGPPSC